MASVILELMDSVFGPLAVVPEGCPCHMRHCHSSGRFPDKFKCLGGTLRALLRGVRPVFQGVCPTTDAPLPVVLCFGPESEGAATAQTLVYVGSAPELELLLKWRGRECYFDVMRFHSFGGSHARAAFDVVQCVGLAEHAQAEDPGLNLMAEWAGSPATLCEHFRSQADAAMCLLDGLMFLALGVLEVHSRGFERESAEQLHRLNLLLLSSIPGAGSVSVKAARRVLQSFCQQPVETVDARCELGHAIEVVGMVLQRKGCWMQGLVYLEVVHELAGSFCKHGQAPPPLMSLTRLVRLEVMRESLLGPGLGLPKLRTSMLDAAHDSLGLTDSVMQQLDFEFADVKYMYELPADIEPRAPATPTSEHMLAARTKLRDALAPRKSTMSWVHKSRDAGVEDDGSTPTRGVELERYLFELGHTLATSEACAECLPQAALSRCMLLCLCALRAELFPADDATAETCVAPVAAFEAQLAPFLREKRPAWCEEQARAVLALCEGELGVAVQAQYKACSGDPASIRRETTRQAACAHAHINLSARLKATQPDASYKHIMNAYKYHQRLGLDEPTKLVCAHVCDLGVLFVQAQMVLAPGPQSSQHLRERMALKLLAAFFADVCQDGLVLELVIRTLRASYSYYTSIGSYAHVARILLQIRELSPMDYGFLQVHVVRLEHADGVLNWHVGGSAPLILVCRSMLECVQRRACPYVPFTGAWVTEFHVGDCFFASPDGKLVDAVCTVACRSACAEGEHPTVRVAVSRLCNCRGCIIFEDTEASCKYRLCFTLELNVRVNMRVAGRLLQDDVVAGAPLLPALQRLVAAGSATTPDAGCAYVFFQGGYEQIFAGMTPLGCLGRPLVLSHRQHLDVVAVHRSELGQRRLCRHSSIAQGCALQLADNVLYQWLRCDMPALDEHPELVFRLVAAVDRRELPATMLAEKRVQAFLGQLTRVDEPARACAETMARILCAERHAGFYGLRACMQRFVGLTGQGLLDDASRWLVHVQELWGVQVLERVRAGDKPRLGSFDALSLELFFVLHLLPAAEFVLAPPGTVDLQGDDHRMLVCKAVDRLEICEKMLAQQWCSPAQRALLHTCMAQGLRFLGRNKKRLASCVQQGEAALRECRAEAGTDDVLLDKRVLKGWKGSRLHTLTLQEATDMLLAVHGPAELPAVAPAPEPARAAAAASFQEGAPMPSEQPPLGVDAEPKPPAVAPAPEPARAAAAASFQEGAPMPSEHQAQGVDAELAPPSNDTASAKAPDNQDESLWTCIVCMEHQVATRMPCARAYCTLAVLTLRWRWQRTHVLMPCRHFSLCHSCVVQLSQCPLCNRKIEDTLRIYM